MRHIFKILMFIVIAMACQPVFASGQGYDPLDNMEQGQQPSVVPIPLPQQGPVMYVTPPDWMKGEWYANVPANADPRWLLEHRARVKSKLFKVGAGITGCLLVIGIIFVCGVYDGPTVASNSTSTFSPADWCAMGHKWACPWIW